jgi:hypothetical protein
MTEYLITSKILNELMIKYGYSIVALISHTGYLVQVSCYNIRKSLDKNNNTKSSINKI